MKKIILSIFFTLFTINLSYGYYFGDVDFTKNDYIELELHLNNTNFRDIDTDREPLYTDNFYDKEDYIKLLVAYGIFKYGEKSFLNSTSYIPQEYIEKTGNFNVKLFKKIGKKLLKLKDKNKKLNYLNKLDNKIKKIFKIIEKRKDYYYDRKQFEKYKLYDKYDFIIGSLNESLSFYKDYVRADKYKKRPHIKKKRTKIIYKIPKPKTIEDYMKEIPKLEKEYNCHNYKPYTLNIENIKNQQEQKFYKKMYALSLCIMSNKGVDKDLLNIFYDFKLKLSKFKNKSKGGGTSLSLRKQGGKIIVDISDNLIELNRIQDKGNYLYMDGKNNAMKMVLNTFIHELSHNINFYILNRKDKYKQLNKFLNLAWNGNYNRDKLISYKDKYLGSKKDTIKNKECFTRKYGQENILEDFATFGEYYFLGRILYKQNVNSDCIKQRIQIFKNIIK